MPPLTELYLRAAGRSDGSPGGIWVPEALGFTSCGKAVHGQLGHGHAAPAGMADVTGGSVDIPGLTALLSPITTATAVPFGTTGEKEKVLPEWISPGRRGPASTRRADSGPGGRQALLQAFPCPDAPGGQRPHGGDGLAWRVSPGHIQALAALVWFHHSSPTMPALGSVGALLWSRDSRTSPGSPRAEPHEGRDPARPGPI